MRLSWRVVLSYAAGQFGVGLLPLILLEWVMYFYSPPESEGFVMISPALFGLIRGTERIAGAIAEPLIGWSSDRTKSRFGRRLPWIAMGLPFLIASFVWMWFPPQTTVTNDPKVALHFGVMLMLFFIAYTAVVAPFVALLPELTADSNERVRVSVWMSIFEVLSNVIAAIGAAQLVGLGALAIGGFAFANGYQLLGVTFGLLGLIAFIPVLIVVREPPQGPAQQVSLGFFRAGAECFKNPAFWPYSLAVSSFRFATTCAIVGLPYVATQLMGTSQEVAGLLLAAIIIVASLLFPVVEELARRFGKEHVFVWGGLGFVFVLPLLATIGLIPGLSPLVHGALLFVCSGFSTATLFVLPRAMLADVIDLDEQRTGFRREGMYNGMSGVLEKCGEAGGTAVIGVLFEVFGNTSGEPMGLRLIGIVAAVGVGLGLIAFRRYPLGARA